MKPVSVLQAWNSAFPQSAPAGFLCRQGAADRWVRTHSLPDSKRYAETADERKEVLRRYNAIGLKVLGHTAECLLFVARFGQDQQWTADEGGPLSEMKFTYILTHGTEDDEIQFFATPATWRTNAFDNLLSAVADDRTGPLLFFNPLRGTAFAPYDGGADLFLSSPQEANDLRTEVWPWLSQRPDGL